jgi:uracil-DNA glycosylase family 4
MAGKTTPDPLELVQQRMKKCRLCLEAGYEIYPPAVFSGLATAKMMTIGQAPGITEQQAQRPFNAGSGTRLFGWLQEAGIDETWFRSTQYMTSVTKCYPGRSPAGSGDRVPTRQEQAFCRAYLDQEIQLVNPRVIIPIGRLAINLFFSRSSKLQQIIGTQLEIEGRLVIPLPHSSGASRWHQLPENRQLIEKALGLIREQYRLVFSS